MKKTYIHFMKKTTCLLLSFVLLLISAGCSTKTETETETEIEYSSLQERKTNIPHAEMDTVNLMANFDSDTPDDTKTDRKTNTGSSSSALDDTFLQSVMDFSTRIFQQTNTEKTGNNVMISPISILTALSMTMNGAKGETQEQMLQTLFTNLISSSSDQQNASNDIFVDELNQKMSRLLAQLPSSEDARLLQANSIWFRNDTSLFQPKEDFLQINADYYQADVYSAPFNEQTLTDINSWVSEHTEKRIPQILDEIPSNVVMYLINALSFDAAWESPYKENEIHEGTFTNADGSTSMVSTMYSEENKYLETAHATGFIKPYAEGYSFAALLPEEGLSLDKFIQELTGEELLTALSHASEEIVLTSLPKFTSDYETELSEVLSDMGMELPFDDKYADFSNMGTVEPDYHIYISRVIHKTSISVDENGTRAGAATAVEMLMESCIAEFHEVYLNRPFIYLIIDESTNLPIFMGTVAQLP